ncbi:MAG: hypothetical protein R6V58_14010, partial [Planctomycetota bacterium]
QDPYIEFTVDVNCTTEVDDIVPYEQGCSPIGVTAEGGNFLDSVDLFYRYSTDNSSWNKQMEYQISGQDGYMEYKSGVVLLYAMHQTFTVGFNGVNKSLLIENISLYMVKHLVLSPLRPSGGIYVEIVNCDDDGLPLSPYGKVLGTSDVYLSTDIGTSYAWHTLVFDTPVLVDQGGVYSIRFVSSFVHSTNSYIRVGYNTSGDLYGGGYRIQVNGTLPPTYQVFYDSDFLFNISGVWMYYGNTSVFPWGFSFVPPWDMGFYEFWSLGRYSTDWEGYKDVAEAILNFTGDCAVVSVVPWVVLFALQG